MGVIAFMSLKKKLRERGITIGSWITLGHPSIAEIMAQAGFDWLTVDMEHSAITLYHAQQLIQIISLSGCVPLVRVGSNDPTIIKRVMDSGAHGVIVPMVNNVKDAKRAVSAAKYPPTGTRGVGLARAQGYGTKFEEYKDWLEKEGVVIVQVEHIDAVNNLEEILHVDGVDGFIVGPYDLSGSLGVPGQFEHKKVKDALERVRSIAQTRSVSSGFHVIPPDPDKLLEKTRDGYTFLAFSLDILFLGEMCRRGLSSIRNLLAN